MIHTPVILCFGDSNTHGTPPMKSILDLDRFPEHQRWPGVVREVLGDRVRVIEEGQPGRTTVHDNPAVGGGRSGLAALPFILESHRPIDCIVIMLGTNDLHDHLNVGPLVISLGVGQLILKIRQMPCGPKIGESPKILVVSPPPVQERSFAAPILVGAAEKSQHLAEQYEQLAVQHGVDFIDAGEVIEVDPLDGVHFSAESHIKLGHAIAEKLRSMLTRE